MSVANVDPELRPLLEAYLEMGLDLSPDRVAEVRDGLRSIIDATPLHRPTSVVVEDVTAAAGGDHDPVLRIYRPREDSAPVPLLYWIHGGGMVIGSYDMDDALLVGAVERLGLAVASVEYRLAPEHPDPAPADDCYHGLVWMAAHAAEYGIDADRVAVGGASAGGGLAAGTALRARDCGGPALRFQLLLEPMLDDRSITRSSTEYDRSVVWDRNDNRSGWTALLGPRVGTEQVSPYAAPARATDLSGLPPTLVDVGEVETFRGECFEYARRLADAGISTEFHMYRGAFHGFDLLAGDSAVARQAWGIRWSALARALELPLPDPAPL